MDILAPSILLSLRMLSLQILPRQALAPDSILTRPYTGIDLFLALKVTRQRPGPTGALLAMIS